LDLIDGNPVKPGSGKGITGKFKKGVQVTRGLRLVYKKQYPGLPTTIYSLN